VLKKAGIVVAAAAAGLLAVSPLAFAGEMGDHGDKGHHHDKGDHKSYSKHDDHSTKYDHSPQCIGAPQKAVINNPQTADGATGLLALLGIGANVLGPVTPQLQAPILSCNNLENIANVDIHDNVRNNDF
jgi:hypothetical protein